VSAPSKASPPQPAAPELPALDWAALRRSLLAWYDRHGRELPWRQTRDPYPIWVSEVMLQQTQVKTVLPYYRHWLAQFPDVAALAAADRQAVLKAWEGLGYYARARNLHAAAQQLMQERNGRFPATLAEAMALPGIGRTTAGGILSAAFGQRTAILDGNVKRVLARLSGLSVPPSRATQWLWQLSDALVDPQRPGDFNQALMDLGATLCVSQAPKCLLCPWRTHCHAYAHSQQGQIPVRERSVPLPHKQIGVGVVWDAQGRILIDRRPAQGLLGGLWEFPGGKLEAGERVEDCIRREIAEEIGIAVEPGERLMAIEHAYTHYRVTLNVHHCRYLSGEPQALGCDEVRWVAPEQLPQFPFPKANTQIVDALLAQRSPEAGGR